ncbi:MAG: hypothetical protein FWC16_10275 [Defluviitaleaceae bacterium]|nr:hypothetical protein [Defluviitaleaceae bacterium]MCL2275302.1 hypothetical protein [Defluviitaleaceae bacterium]
MANQNSALWASMNQIPVAQEMGNAHNWAHNSRVPNSELGRQEFLNLLMTQLKFQDPLDPMDDRDFMAQMAQFSALEQMMNLNHTFERTQAFGHIGMEVDYAFRHPVSGEWVEGHGIVQAVNAQGSDIYVLVNGIDVPLAAVQVVSQSPQNPVNEVLSAVNQARIQDMVGRTIQALIHNAQGEVTDFVEGVVDYVKISGNQSILVVGNREVFPWEVATVGNDYILLNSTYFTNGDRLARVDIRNNRAFLVFANANGEEVSVEVERINYAMEALQFVGRFIQDGPVAGDVVSVTIRNGVPFFNVRMENEDGTYEMGEIAYLQYLAARVARQGGGNSSSNNTNNNTNNNDTSNND